MNKLKEKLKENKVGIVIAGAVIIGGVILVFNKKKPAVPVKPIVIDPAYYKTLEEAIEAFKTLAKDTVYPVLCGGGDGIHFGVFDESILLK